VCDELDQVTVFLTTRGSDNRQHLEPGDKPVIDQGEGGVAVIVFAFMHEMMIDPRPVKSVLFVAIHFKRVFVGAVAWALGLRREDDDIGLSGLRRLSLRRLDVAWIFGIGGSCHRETALLGSK
jgi:hypothetical protein